MFTKASEQNIYNGANILIIPSILTQAICSSIYVHTRLQVYKKRARKWQREVEASKFFYIQPERDDIDSTIQHDE